MTQRRLGFEVQQQVDFGIILHHCPHPSSRIDHLLVLEEHCQRGQLEVQQQEELLESFQACFRIGPSLALEVGYRNALL